MLGSRPPAASEAAMPEPRPPGPNLPDASRRPARRSRDPALLGTPSCEMHGRTQLAAQTNPARSARNEPDEPITTGTIEPTATTPSARRNAPDRPAHARMHDRTATARTNPNGHGAAGSAKRPAAARMHDRIPRRHERTRALGSWPAGRWATGDGAAVALVPTEPGAGVSPACPAERLASGRLQTARHPRHRRQPSRPVRRLLGGSRPVARAVDAGRADDGLDMARDGAAQRVGAGAGGAGAGGADRAPAGARRADVPRRPGCRKPAGCLPKRRGWR